MSRPIWLRQITWQFARTKILSLDPKQHRRLARRLGYESLWPILKSGILTGQLLLELQILRHPRLLANTVIELPNECEYLLTDQAARRLAGRRKIELHRLYDGKLQSWTPKQIKDALAGPVFDQLDRPIHPDETAKPTA
jgi:hypothetical protein